MFRTKRIALALLLLLAAIVVAGCKAAAPKLEPQRLEVREGELLPADERPEVISFDGTDLYSGEAISFSADAQDRVRMISFFSPG